MTNARAYGQKVVATNPCGEQPLTPYAVCNLSAINLANFVDKETHTIKSEELANTVKTAIKFQDLVIDTTPYFLKENEHQAKSERRIGLGVMGLADMLIYCHKRYGSAEGNDLINRVFRLMAITSYRESIELAKIKGSFPFLIGTTKGETDELRHRFIDTGYMKNMPEDVREDILKYGIRNSHLLTVAPTGSTGTMTGVSTGLEPYFSFKYYRSGRLGKFIEVNADIAEEYFVNHPKSTELPDYFVSAMQLSPKEHVDVQCTIQRWVDSSISKTVNMPKGSSVNDVAEIYQDLYEGGAKGGTVYVDGSRDSQVLTLDKNDNNEDGFADELDTDNKSTEEDDNESVNNDDEPLTEEEHNLLFDENGNRRKEGNDAGNICPICHKGIVQTIGGCSSCPNCKAQLKCGL
jgi:ribonucleoside-diphosphate reductase alpha chain